MKDYGRWVEHTVKACLFIQREKCIRVIGCMTKLKDRGPMCIQMELNMKANGFTTCNREKGLRNGPMDQFLWENIEKARRMGSESISGSMGHVMKGSGKTTRLLAMASTNGLMEESTWGTGKAILWTSSGFIHGKTEGCMKDSTRKTKSTATEYIPGPTLRSMQAGGAEASSMD
jgi:hypothetical protein